MKATELRIGNYVFNDYLFKNKEINGIFDQEIWLCEIGEYEFDQRSNIDCIEPIPLTEEWLLKFGFELYDWKLNGKHAKKEWVKGMFVIEANKNNTDFRFKSPLKFIDHVHQLQNLYHALTGEELVTK